MSVSNPQKVLSEREQLNLRVSAGSDSSILTLRSPAYVSASLCLICFGCLSFVLNRLAVRWLLANEFYPGLTTHWTMMDLMRSCPLRPRRP